MKLVCARRRRAIVGDSWCGRRSGVWRIADSAQEGNTRGRLRRDVHGVDDQYSQVVLTRPERCRIRRAEVMERCVELRSRVRTDQNVVEVHGKRIVCRDGNRERGRVEPLRELERGLVLVAAAVAGRVGRDADPTRALGRRCPPRVERRYHQRLLQGLISGESRERAWTDNDFFAHHRDQRISLADGGVAALEHDGLGTG